jgi:predicted nucleic acid-binding protein
MIVVDSGVWVDFFNGTQRQETTRLRHALQEEEDLVTLPIIVAEVLQGFRTDARFEQARNVLEAVPHVQPTLGCHVRAAALYRYLRRRGITVRGIVDCVIAQTCLDLGAELLSPDADFERIAGSTSLRLWTS